MDCGIFLGDSSVLAWLTAMEPAQAECEAAAAAARQRLGFFRVELEEVRSEDDIFSALAKDLRVPWKMGRNWNAALDVISDLTWVPADRYLVVFAHAGRLASLGAEIVVTFVEVVNSARLSAIASGIPLTAVMCDPEESLRRIETLCRGLVRRL